MKKGGEEEEKKAANKEGMKEVKRGRKTTRRPSGHSQIQKNSQYHRNEVRAARMIPYKQSKAAP